MYMGTDLGFRAVQFAEIRPASKSFSANDVWTFPNPAWLTATLTQLDRVESGPNAAGIGDFRNAYAAANAIRSIVSTVTLQSLPFPEVVPASGGAIVAIWRSGDRVLELAGFPDGNTVFERLESGVEIEDADQAEPWDTYFRWVSSRA
jgi:hypothetical protein